MGQSPTKLISSSVLIFVFCITACIAIVDSAVGNPTETARLIEEDQLTQTAIISPEVVSTLQSVESTALADVGLWKRFEVTLSNSSWNGNPFDLDLVGVFMHSGTGETLTQLGFYAGGNTWKIYFMPDRLGEWTYVTQSSDPDLDGQSGTFNAVPSNLPGKLTGVGNRWVLEGSGEHVAPILLSARDWFKRTNTAAGVDDFIFWARDTAGAMVIGTTLVYFNLGQDEVPYIKGQEGEQFNLPMWDRLNSHYDLLRDQGMGFYIMFYSDDAESPNNFGVTAQSQEEIRLFRYAVARFAAYPIVIWDTGIDIGETRSSSWIDWFVNWFDTHDPWRHPASSRTGGGSGGKFPNNAGYYSDGAATLPNHAEVVSDWSSRSVPTAYTDRWREDYTRGNFDSDKIRRAAWEVGLVGGTAAYFGGNENGGYLEQNYATDLKAAPCLGYRDRFFRERINDLSALDPHDELLTSGNGVVLSADPGSEYVAYDRNGGTIGIDLSGATGNFVVEWLNPRTGQYSNASAVSGGGPRSFTPPFSGDAVLHLEKGNTSLSNFASFVTKRIYLPTIFGSPISFQGGSCGSSAGGHGS